MKSNVSDIPKIFWKYFDLYRRKKITLEQYITPELEHRKSGYVERKRRPYQGNVVRIA